MTGPLRTFEGPQGRLWRVFLRPRTEGLSGSANLGAEDLVFESEDEEREERVLEGYGLGVTRLADLGPGQIADLFTQAQPRRAGQEMSFPFVDGVRVEAPDGRVLHCHVPVTDREKKVWLVEVEGTGDSEMIGDARDVDTEEYVTNLALDWYERIYKRRGRAS
jgi:hypothetical protein